MHAGSAGNGAAVGLAGAHDHGGCCHGDQPDGSPPPSEHGDNSASGHEQLGNGSPAQDQRSGQQHADQDDHVGEQPDGDGQGPLAGEQLAAMDELGDQNDEANQDQIGEGDHQQNSPEDEEEFFEDEEEELRNE